MRALLQRVTSASVTFSRDGAPQSNSIGQGLVIFLGVAPADHQGVVEKLAAKIAALRIFEDSAGKMNLSLRDVAAEVLLISQFTLYAECKKGKRPSFTASAPPEIAEPLYQEMARALGELCEGRLKTGSFGAHMEVALVNDGPVTIWLDSEDLARPRT